MFLLKPSGVADPIMEAILFTFHNVSIKTLLIFDILKCDITLHSTMFLLKQKQSRKDAHVLCFFTFHNVSIKTTTKTLRISIVHHFTFHNVSIKTSFEDDDRLKLVDFTFHNVSIKTNSRGCRKCINNLYIPQCFY